MGKRKNLDVYFVLDSLYRRAFEELQKSLDKTLDTGDFISPKLHAKICKNYEKNYDNTIAAIDKEYKRLLKRRKKAQKKGLINHNEEIYYLLQQAGVYFLEDLQEDTEESLKKTALDNVAQQDQANSTQNNVNVADACNVQEETPEENAKKEPAPADQEEEKVQEDENTEEETPEENAKDKPTPADQEEEKVQDDENTKEETPKDDLEQDVRPKDAL